MTMQVLPNCQEVGRQVHACDVRGREGVQQCQGAQTRGAPDVHNLVHSPMAVRQELLHVRAVAGPQLCIAPVAGYQSF